MMNSRTVVESLSSSDLRSATWDLVRRSHGLDAALLVHLGEIEERMTGVVTISEELAKDARHADFDDLHRKTDALRQQLLAARNRIGLLKEALVKAVPRTLFS